MERWISLHEKLKEHWVFNDHNALRIWLLLLWDANYKDIKVRVDGKLMDVKTGQYVTSIRQLAIRYGFSRYIISKVLDDLEKDGMIIRQPVGRSWTLLTIVNYTKYQGKQPKNEKNSASDLANDLASNLTNDLANDSPQVNKVYINQINNKREEPQLPPVKIYRNTLGKYQNVYLSNEECAKLVKEFGEASTNATIESLSIHLQTKKTNYRDDGHYAVICKWITDDRKKNPRKEDEDINARQRAAIKESCKYGLG